MTAATSQRRSWPETQRILRLAWPVFIGQLAVVAFGTVDTFLIARHSAADLAALAVGQAAYITVFIGFMGMVLALGPIVGQHFGAGRLEQAGRQLHQAIWVALVLSLVGSTVLIFPEPFLAIARADEQVQAKVRSYLLALAFSLPASLLFAAFRGFNNAVSRPKAVMALQLGGLALKVPLSALLIYGAPNLGLPAFGVAGAGLSTCLAMWLQVMLALRVAHRDPFYLPFKLTGQGLHAPDGPSIRNQLKLGVPMGLSILIEVTAFSFMAIFISRLGTTAVAGHQIAANLVSVLFMLPLAIGNATGTLVAQRLGAEDRRDATQIGWRGLRLGTGLAAAVGLCVYLGRAQVVSVYTGNAAVAAACLPLLTWVVVFHSADAAQTICTFVLRAHRIATAPTVIFASSLWGIGLGGGYVLAFDVFGLTPVALRGAPGFWVASTVGLTVAALALWAVLRTALRKEA